MAITREMPWTRFGIAVLAKDGLPHARRFKKLGNDPIADFRHAIKIGGFSESRGARRRCRIRVHSDSGGVVELDRIVERAKRNITVPFEGR